MNQYVRPEEARRILKVTDDTLRKWDKAGKIECIRIGGGTHRRYNITPFLSKNEEKEEGGEKSRRKICYARVSSASQKGDLEKQIAYLSERYPDYELISEVGSGLNFKRKRFKAILESAIRGDIEEIVVSYRDRLCRFGFELIEWLLSKNKGRIVVLNGDKGSPREELVGDLISIITIFSARVHRLRKYGEQLRSEDLENKVVSDGGTED